MSQYSRIKESLKILLDVRVGRGRNLIVNQGDTFLVSYPKSGNTWVRFLVGNLLSEQSVGFSNIETIVPDIYLHSNSYLQNEVYMPRVLKSHEYFDPRYKNIIYVVRDPRDVVVSYYHHHKKFKQIDKSYPIGVFINNFIKGSWDPYGSWGENVGGWLGAKSSDASFLLIRYEDLLLNPLQELRRISIHLGLNRTDNELNEAIRNSSFDKMRTLELKQGSEWKALKGASKDTPFVRRGEAGEWTNVLSAVEAHAIETAWGDVMRELRYLVA